MAHLLQESPFRTAAAPKARLRYVIAGALVAAGVVVAIPVSRTMLIESVTSFEVAQWPWLIAAVIAEAGSMAAFARAQRRLLRAGGAPLPLGAVLAVTLAGNAISTSVPFAGPGLSGAFSVRQFRYRGVEDGVIPWAMIVSGLVSSAALTLLLMAGAVTVGSATPAFLGVAGGLLTLVPVAALLVAVHSPRCRQALNRVLTGLVVRSRRRFGRPDLRLATRFEQSLERVVAIRIPARRYAGIFALAEWNWLADCLCLVFAIQASGSPVPWRGLLLAYGAGKAAGSIGLTPGGIGITEAALAGSLVVAGMGRRTALDSVLTYRLISFWIVVASGWVVLAALSRHQGEYSDAGVRLAEELDSWSRDDRVEAA